MEYYYLIIVGILFFLAISDLVVGVSNDAVNFMNSAIGAKASSFRILMIIASLGVLVGALFSGGMMEVARSGIFHPTQFYFHEIMLLFLAVMITDVLLLDFFNTLGLPTSTTVSLVFELLGAAFVFSIIKIMENGETLLQLSKYLNSEKALAIISAIFISIAIAFTIGFIVMYFARIIFTYLYEKYMLIGGSIFGGISIAIISYFIFLKGLNDLSFVPEAAMTWINGNILLIIAVLTISLTVLFFIIQLFIKLNVFKVVVFFGTFALAMAFAGNDLVNFIGVPMAGFKSFEIYSASGSLSPETFSMEMLAKPVSTPMGFLIAAGVIMIITLWFSKKARTVIETSVNLSKQNDGKEQFGSNSLARGIVRFFYNAGAVLSSRYTRRISQTIDKRFQQTPAQSANANAPAFDMVRAALNLMVASTLIALGTSMKLPLSTTYVTFMVAMGTSLADRAWGRESAVYRVSGVFVVIGGWFITALVAFIVAAIIALILWWGQMIAVAIMIPLMIFILYRTHRYHKRMEEDKKSKTNLFELLKTDPNKPEIIAAQSITEIILQIPDILNGVHKGLKKEDPKLLKQIVKKILSLDKKTNGYVDSINEAVKTNNIISLEWTEFFMKANESLRGLAVSTAFIAKPSKQHLNNLHTSLNTAQLKDFEFLNLEISLLSNFVSDTLTARNSVTKEQILEKHNQILNEIDKIRQNQIERIKKKETPSRSSLLFLNIVSELRLISFLLVDLYLLDKSRANK